MAETGDAVAYALDNETGDMINMRRVGRLPEMGGYRDAWSATVYVNGALLISEAIMSGVGGTLTAREALSTLVSFIEHACDEYSSNMRERDTPDDGWTFGTRAAGEWCCQWADDLYGELSEPAND